MRILFTTYPEKTHFMVQAPLAWALRTAGHEVRFAVQPKFVDQVTQAGLTAVPIGADRDLWQVLGRAHNMVLKEGPGLSPPYDAAERHADDITWDYLRGGYEFQIEKWHKMSNVPMIADLVAYAREWKPDLVIWEPVTYAGAIAAQASGAAHARMLVGADAFGITREHYLRLNSLQPRDKQVDALGTWLRGYARRYGSDFSEDLVTGNFTIDVLPPSLQVHADLPYLSVRYVPYGGPASVPRWLWSRPDRPRVALTLGLTVTDHGIGYPVSVEDILESLADLDIEVVATIADEEKAKLSRIPGNARLVSYVPLQALAPTCSAVIHHAGVGTLATVALQGVPQLTLPWDVDQPLLSDRMVAKGAALSTHATKATGQIVRDDLLRLLAEPKFRHGAAELRDEMLATPSPNEIVPRLEELVTEFRARPAAARW